MYKSNPELEWISAEKIMEKYPSLENLPESYIGNISSGSGIIKAKAALNGFRILALQYGATLKYNTGKINTV